MDAKKRAALPELFQGLTGNDWGRVRAWVATMKAGEEEAVVTEVGYVDAGRTERGGLPYIAAMSMDSAGNGPLSYRRVMMPAWPA